MAAMEEATKKGINIPLDTMLSRLFGAAANGERDPEKLKEATATSTKNSALGMQTSEDSGGRR
jgi:hypothetical protein